MRSAGEGVASLGDIGPQAYTLGENALRAAGSSLANIPTELSAAWNAKSGELPNAPKPAPTEVDPTPTFYRDIYNSEFPVTPGYENSWTREVGNVAGPTLLTLGVGSAPAIIERAATARPQGSRRHRSHHCRNRRRQGRRRCRRAVFRRRYGPTVGRGFGLVGLAASPLLSCARRNQRLPAQQACTDEQSPQRLADMKTGRLLTIPIFP